MANPNKNLCPTCATLIKLVDGRRTCIHKTRHEELNYSPDATGKILDLKTKEAYYTAR